MCFSGLQAEEILRHIHFYKVILGAGGYDIDAGITTYFEHEAPLNRLMCDVSSEVIAIQCSAF